MPTRRDNTPGGGGQGSWQPSWEPKDSRKGGVPKRKKKGKKLPEGFKPARRDVMLTVRPLKREIRRVRRQGTRDARQQQARTANVYEALGAALAPLSSAYTSEAGQIANMLQGELGSLGGMLNTNVPLVPGAEVAAGKGVMGSLGGGALANLASNAQRNLGYNTSTMRQGAMESAIGQRNILQDLADFRRDLGQQRIDIMRDVPALIRQRMDQLRDVDFQQWLARKQLELDQLVANRDYNLGMRGLNLQAASDAATAKYLSDVAAAEAAAGRGRG